VSQSRRPRARVAALLAVVVGVGMFVACEETWNLDVFVRVAPTVELDAQPALQILVAIDGGDDGYAVFLVGYACGGDPFAGTARFLAPLGAGAAPAAPVAVEGWLEPVPGGVAPFCGALPTPKRVAPAPRPRSRPARADVVTPVGCGGGAVHAATLDLGAEAEP
jgi:hypothetical protein